MRRLVFLTLGVLEVAVACVLCAFAWQLPGSDEILHQANRVERVSRETGEQVGVMRRRLAGLRQRRPLLDDLTEKLHAQMRQVNGHLRHQQVDYETVQTMSDALGDVAKGLDGLSAMLDPDGLGQIGKGLGETADYLDGKVAPTADRAATQLEQTTKDLRADALGLSALLKEAPPDLAAAREVYDGLGKFDEGLERMERIVKVQKMTEIREGFKGLEDSLKTGADQVERLAGYTYPAVRFQGLKPVVEQKDFWPEGKTIAAGMRKGVKGVAAAGEKIEALARDLPELEKSIAASRKVVGTTRASLARALAQRKKVEGLLKDVPEKAARLAEGLPELSADLARVLRDTEKLKEVAKVLRQTQAGVDVAVARWPVLRRNLGRSSELLRATQKELEQALAHRDEYESSLRQMMNLLEAFVGVVPLLTQSLDVELRQEEASLAQLEEGLAEVSKAVPEAGNSAARIVGMSRLLLLLMSAVFGLHGGYLLAGWRLGPKYSG
jgi:uncharacterized phage infection (PIP) family protein YhgE